MTQTKADKLICPRCKYAQNPPSNTNCELCSAELKPNLDDRLLPEPKPEQDRGSKPDSSSLRQQPASSKQTSQKFVSHRSTVSPVNSTFQLVFLLTLSNLMMVIVLGGSYLFWQNWNRATSFNARASVEDPSELNREYRSDSSNIYSNSATSMKRTMEEVSAPEGLFNYGGAICFAALTKYGMNDAIASAHPEFNLRYTEPLNSKPGCSTGIGMLLDSELSFAQNGRPLQESEYAIAKSRNFTLKQIPVAIDGIVFFVNPQLPIEGLTINQLKDVFQGKITNWQQVGGPDLPVVAISQDPNVHITINSLLDNGEQLGKEVKIVRDYTTAMREVGNIPGSISYSSAAIARGQETIRGVALAATDSDEYVLPFTRDGRVNLEAFRDSSYPLTRRLFIVVREDGTIEEQAGNAYANLLLTDEGQQIIERAGFVPLYE